MPGRTQATTITPRCSNGANVRCRCLERDPPCAAHCPFHLHDLLRCGAIDPVIVRELSFAELEDGMRLIEGRAVYGKVIIRQGPETARFALQ